MNAGLQPYRGPLAPAEITAGIRAAQQNAERLLRDAKILAEAQRFPSATALAILAIEERGKVVILKRLALMTDPKELRSAWKEYRSHRAKNAGWIIPKLAGDGARTLDAMRAAVDSSAEHTALLDSLKQISFYTDCLGERHWSVPDTVIDKALANSIIIAAEGMWGGRPVTAREIELWSAIVGPHYNRPGMIDAVVRFQAAMHQEGLSETPPDKLNTFLRGGEVEF